MGGEGVSGQWPVWWPVQVGRYLIEVATFNTWAVAVAVAVAIVAGTGQWSVLCRRVMFQVGSTLHTTYTQVTARPSDATR